MGTQTKTSSDQSNKLQFDPGSLSTYQSLTGSGADVLKQYMNSPLKNPMYNLGLQQSMQGANQSGQNNMQALQSIMKTSGMGGTAGQGFSAAQQAQMGRANTSMSSQANISNIMAALQRQMGATGMAMSFSPLMTGSSGTSNSQTSTGGLGTWLPQLIGSAAGMAMGNPMAAKGLAGMGSNAAGSAPAFSGGMGSMSSAMNMPSNAFAGFPSNLQMPTSGAMPMMGMQ